MFLKKKGCIRITKTSLGEGSYFWDIDGKRYIEVSDEPVAKNLGSGGYGFMG